MFNTCSHSSAGQLIDGIFLISWRVLPPRLDGDRTLRRKLAIMISASLLVWLVLSGVQFVIGHFLVDGDVWRGWCHHHFSRLVSGT